MLRNKLCQCNPPKHNLNGILLDSLILLGFILGIDCPLVVTFLAAGVIKSDFTFFTETLF